MSLVAKVCKGAQIVVAKGRSDRRPSCAISVHLLDVGIRGILCHRRRVRALPRLTACWHSRRMSQCSQPNTVSVQRFVDDIAPLDSDGKTVICYEHRTRARRLTSRTVANPGRAFYGCSLPYDDPNRCGFFIWADDHRLLSAMRSISSNARDLGSSPERPSQARRAHMARSPATPISQQKRQRTPSPSHTSTIAGGPMTPKRGRIEGCGGTQTRVATPALTPSQRAARQAEIEKGIKEAKKLARLASIEEALAAAAQGPSQDKTPSGTPAASSARAPHPSTSGSSRVEAIEAAPQFSREHRSDVPQSSSPSSASRSGALPRMPSRPPLSTQSEAGYSISSEIEEADLEELEDKAVQTDPCDDEESVMQNFFESPPPRSLMGSPVVYAGAVGYVHADGGSGSSRSSLFRVPDEERGRGWWMPAPPPLTPGRGQHMRVSTPGGNEGGVLPTPPGTSQTDGQSASQIGRPASLQHGVAHSPSPSPTRTKGKGRELPRSVSSSTSSPQWQMVPDDPENPFHERAAPARIDSPMSSLSGADGLFGIAGSSAGPLSADIIESQVLSLANIPDYVRRLERRDRAARNSADIKSRRIAQLEEEVQRLRYDNRALEETIAALQVRR
ncbi:hypothetical protein C8Q80DRAFT_876535 [Daedaleopsis nitida]|nr:hypothetical protein C8Q80DRAFT_876535 [Daedaleopsis nitida]